MVSNFQNTYELGFNDLCTFVLMTFILAVVMFCVLFSIFWFHFMQFASIFAFATCGGFKGKTEIQVNCLSAPGENKTITATFGYPFRLNQASFHSPPNVNVCKVNWEKHVLIGDYSSSAQFYVTFAVLVFLYCIAALLLYVGYTNLYRDSRKLPMIIFGFLNMILWGGNAWFVYKETSLHSPSNTSASHGQGGVPPTSGM